jgi:hypothetical protein
LTYPFPAFIASDEEIFYTNPDNFSQQILHLQEDVMLFVRFSCYEKGLFAIVLSEVEDNGAITLNFFL